MITRWARGARIALAASLLALVPAVFSAPQVALAHAYLIRGDPVPGSVLTGAPTRVHLWFSEDLNGTASKIVVWNRFRHDRTAGDAHLLPGQPRQLEVALHPLTPGSYLVLWTSVSALDGHILRGSYSFSVGHRGLLPSLSGLSFGGTTDTFPDAGTAANIAAHWLELLAAVIWVGSSVFSAFVLGFYSEQMEPPIRDAEERRLRQILQFSLGILFIASAAVFLLEAESLAGSWSDVLAGNTVRELLSGQYGQLWVARQLLVLIALACTLGPAMRRMHRFARREWSPWPGLLAAVGVVYLYVLAGSGHAASAQIGPLLGSRLFSASVFVDWLHLLGSSLWLGGQIYIVVVLAVALRVRKELGPHAGVFLSALNRFSPVAYASIAMFTVTGAFNGKIHISSWYAFFHSVYGWALTVKIVLIGMMMLVSVVTVYGLRPRLRRAMAAVQEDIRRGSAVLMDSLVRWLRAGPVLGLGVLLATSVMFYYPVPAGLAPPPPSSYSVNSGGIEATLSLKPAKAGPNTFIVRLMRGGKPMTGARIVVLTTMLDMVMGTGLVTLNAAGPGVYKGTGDLGMGGHWRLQILVYHGSTLTRLTVEARIST